VARGTAVFLCANSAEEPLRPLSFGGALRIRFAPRGSAIAFAAVSYREARLVQPAAADRAAAMRLLCGDDTPTAEYQPLPADGRLLLAPVPMPGFGGASVDALLHILSH
jgi:hypothetical protein